MMGELGEVLDKLVAEAAVLERDVAEWISRGRGPDEPMLRAVAVAFAQRACSTAARGVERPERPILLAGAWQTPIAWPLLDVAAAAHLAYDKLVDEHGPPPAPAGRTTGLTVGLAGEGRVFDPTVASDAWSWITPSEAWGLAIVGDATGALEHRCHPETRLRDLVRDVERELYHAAKALALKVEAAALALEEPPATPTSGPGACAAALIRAAGHAIAVAAVAPEIPATAGSGTWANVVNRYYH